MPPRRAENTVFTAAPAFARLAETLLRALSQLNSIVFCLLNQELPRCNLRSNLEE
jgi:hypothetical protein